MFSDQYHNFNFCEFFVQNGCRRPFWISKNLFWSHFCPFQINTKLVCNFLHIGCRRPFWMSKIHFDRISGHFRLIRNFNFFGNFWQTDWRWPFWMSEIHFWSHFWPFQINTNFFFGVHFGCTKITFDGISGHFRSIRNLILFKNFGCSQITLDRISGHFRSIHNFFFKFLTKWPPPAIFDAITMSIIELVRDIWMSNACVKS